MGREINKKHIKIIPCPDYDIEGMESWLSDMAASGLMLKKDGFFANFASFEECTPCKVRYRLQAASEKKSILSEDNREPDDEVIEIARHYGWEYVASRGRFYIYRTNDPQARELNTDPEVQALVIGEVRKRERRDAIAGFLSPIILLLITTKGSLMTTMLTIGTRFSLFGIMLLLWRFIDSMMSAIHMKRLRKRIITYGTLDHNKQWKNRTRLYHISNVLWLVLMISWTIVFYRVASDYDNGIGRIRTYSYEGQVPFSTMRDLLPGGKMIGYNESDSYVYQKQDWLAPVIIEWKENATIASSDGSKVSGIWMVDYYETAAPWIARQVAKEYFIRDKLKSYFDKLELQLPELEADYSVWYSSLFPTVIIQKDCVVVYARFAGYSEQRLPDEIWISILADSIK